MPSTLDFELKHGIKSTKAVLLFHGLTGSPFEMRKYAKHLHNDGFDIYCFCLAGHGDDADMSNMTSENWVNDSMAHYELLRPKYEHFFLAGLCLGSVVALRLAQEYNNATGIMCLSTTLFLDGWRFPWYAFLMPVALFSILRFYYVFAESDPYGIKNENTREKIKKIISKSRESGFAMDNYPFVCVYELVLLSRKVRKEINKVNIPLLLVHSKEDDLASIKSANFVCDNVASAKKEFVVLNDSYHMILYDNEKDLVFEKSVQFMDGIIQNMDNNNKIDPEPESGVIIQ